MKDIQEHNRERLRAVQAFLKWYRINSGFNQQELSEYSDVHRNTISRYESCSPKNLTLLTIFEIADALELDVNQIQKYLQKKDLPLHLIHSLLRHHTTLFRKRFLLPTLTPKRIALISQWLLQL